MRGPREENDMGGGGKPVAMMVRGLSCLDVDSGACHRLSRSCWRAETATTPRGKLPSGEKAGEGGRRRNLKRFWKRGSRNCCRAPPDKPDLLLYLAYTDYAPEGMFFVDLVSVTIEIVVPMEGRQQVLPPPLGEV